MDMLCLLWSYVSHCRLLKFMGSMMSAFGSEFLSILVSLGILF